jgi:predicted Rossmann-fold nucleotide-binding protein
MIETKRYAGVGARQTPVEILQVMRAIARALAKDGYTVQTGAARGADQAFAEGALHADGTARLCLPWGSYEKDWVKSLASPVILDVLQDTDVEAFASVEKFHPSPHVLKQSVKRLHARNFCILRQCEFVVCWTPGGVETGGTGQALRIAEHQKQVIWNLGNPEVLAMYVNRLTERGEL